MNDSNTLDFIAEAGMLKRIKRSGWWMLGIPEEESVAEHSFRCAVIAYIIAKMEKIEPYKAVMMAIFNDYHEARINDLHKVAHRYIDVRSAEKKAFAEQTAELDAVFGKELRSLRAEHDGQKTRDSLIARDADILECLIQAKEFSDLGYKSAKKFFRKAPLHLKTKSAKKLWKSAGSWDSDTWWEKLGKFER